LSGRGLCDELITRPDEAYRLWCVVVCDLEIGRPPLHTALQNQLQNCTVTTTTFLDALMNVL